MELFYQYLIRVQTSFTSWAPVSLRRICQDQFVFVLNSFRILSRSRDTYPRQILPIISIPHIHPFFTGDLVLKISLLIILSFNRVLLFHKLILLWFLPERANQSQRPQFYRVVFTSPCKLWFNTFLIQNSDLLYIKTKSLLSMNAFILFVLC